MKINKHRINKMCINGKHAAKKREGVASSNINPTSNTCYHAGINFANIMSLIHGAASLNTICRTHWGEGVP